MKFFFFGDSICFGQGVSLHKGWVPNISKNLSFLAEEKGVEIVIVNNAVNGRTTRQALETMPYEVQSHRPDLLLLQFGMNDCNYWQSDGGLPRVSPAAFKANLREIIQRSFLFGAKRVFLNTNHPTTLDFEALRFTETVYEESNRFYNSLIREVYREGDERLILNDMEKTFHVHTRENGSELSELLLADRLHLSEKGHVLYFETIFPVLKQVVLEIAEDSKVGSL